MSKYQHILNAVASEVWVIDPAKGAQIIALLSYRASGGRLTPDEVAAQIGTAQARRIRERSGSVAVVPLHGVMSQRVSGLKAISGGTSSEAVGRALDEAVADDAIKAIILHVDSPGGGLHGTRELAAKVRAARETKPVVAQVDSLAASAAYWVASQASEVVSTPGGDVGSVGVYTVHEDVSGLLDAEGIKETLVFAGRYKVEANPFEPLADGAREHLQQRVDAAYSDFLREVADGRGTSSAEVESGYGEGRVVRAADALKAGMIDRVATFDETLARYSRAPKSNYQRRAAAARAIARST